MTRAYPIEHPTSPGFVDAVFGLERRTLQSNSIYTGSRQTFQYPYSIWTAQLTLPPMKKVEAGEWISFLNSLQGRFGTFLLANPDKKLPSGTISIGESITTRTRGEVGAIELSCVSTDVSKADILVPGDFLQIGGGATASLLMVTNRVSSNSAGNCIIEFEPALKRVVSAGSILTWNNPRGVFQLATDSPQWSTDRASVFRNIQISCRESF